MGILLNDILCLMPKTSNKNNETKAGETSLRKTYDVEKHDVYIHGNKIAGIDRKPEGFTLTDTIEGKDRLLMPGLINCHTHNYMSLFRNCADDLAFNDWLFGRILPLEDKLQPEDAYWGCMLSIIEMIKSGTTCFCDMHMHTNQTSRAVDVAGIRAVISRGLVGTDAADEGGNRRLKEAKEEMDMWKGHQRMKFMLAPHAPYSCGAEYLKYVKDHALEWNVGLNIHLAESQKEYTDSLKENGCTSVELLDSLGIFEAKTLAAHCVNLLDSDVAILRDKNVSVVTCPASNMKLGNGFAPITKLTKNGINVCLGTDGAASNNTLNMFREMNLEALIHKGNEMDAQALNASEIIDFATRNAADALGLGEELGAIEEGMTADVIVINLNNAQLVPRNNIVSGLVYAANGTEVDTVIVDGRVLMEKRRLKTIDEDNVFYSARKIAKRLGLE